MFLSRLAIEEVFDFVDAPNMSVSSDGVDGSYNVCEACNALKFVLLAGYPGALCIIEGTPT